MARVTKINKLDKSIETSVGHISVDSIISILPHAVAMYFYDKGIILSNVKYAIDRMFKKDAKIFLNEIKDASKNQSK